MTSAEDAQYDRLRVLTGLIKAEFASLRQQIEDAQASTDEAVAGALSADATADAERLSGLLDELANEVPGDVPDVPVPDPGQPAEEPDDGSNPVPVPGE